MRIFNRKRKLEMIFEFTGIHNYFGVYKRNEHEVHVNLDAFGNGQHINDGKGNYPKRATIKSIIDGVTYTLNHETIHHIQDAFGMDNHTQVEYQVYYMMGNGGNKFFNIYYKIKETPKWMKTIGDKHG